MREAPVQKAIRDDLPGLEVRSAVERIGRPGGQGPESEGRQELVGSSGLQQKNQNVDDDQRLGNRRHRKHESGGAGKELSVGGWASGRRSKCTAQSAAIEI